MSLPKEKTAKELGFKAGDKFRVVEENNFAEGTILTLIKDYKSCCPLFRDERGAQDYEYLSYLEPLEKSLDTLEKGDLLEDKLYGDLYKVLGVLEDLVFLSSPINHDNYNQTFTTTELKNDGWQLHQPNTPKTPREVTMAEVIEKFGEDVVIKKEEE